MVETNLQALQADSISTGYGKRQVLNEVSISVERGQIVALIGHNGSGKSTLLKALFGLVPIWSGALSISGKAIKKPTPRIMLRRSVSYVPQGNRVFTHLTVSENLRMASGASDGLGDPVLAFTRTLELFPELGNMLDRHAGNLSGGEKQTLALASALIRSPRLMLLDEPSLGLSPQLTSNVFQRIVDLNRETGTSFLVVEQKVRGVLRIAQNAYVLRNGAVSFSGPASALADDKRLAEIYV